MNSTQRYNTKFNIEEGYEVRDLNADPFGTVKSVHYYDDAPAITTPPASPAIAPAALDGYAMTPPYGLVFDDLPDLPEEYRRQFYENGFIRIGRGLFHSDMLASFDQISHVSDDCVYLKVSQDDLLKV